MMRSEESIATSPVDLLSQEIHTIDDLKRAFTAAGLTDDLEKYPVEIPGIEPNDVDGAFRRGKSLRGPAKPTSRQALKNRILELLHNTLLKKVRTLALRESVLAKRAAGEEVPADSAFAFANESAVPGYPTGSTMNIGLAGFILNQVENLFPDVTDPHFEAAFHEKGKSIFDTLFLIDRLLDEYQEDVPALVLNIIILTRDRVQTVLEEMDVRGGGENGRPKRAVVPETAFIPLRLLPFEGKDGRGAEIHARLRKVASNVEAAAQVRLLRKSNDALWKSLEHQLIARGLREHAGYILEIFEWKIGVINCHPRIKEICRKGILEILKGLLEGEEIPPASRRLLIALGDKIKSAENQGRLEVVVTEGLTNLQVDAIDNTLALPSNPTLSMPDASPSSPSSPATPDEVLASLPVIDPFDGKHDERGFPSLYAALAGVYKAEWDALIGKEKAQAQAEGRRPKFVSGPEAFRMALLADDTTSREVTLERLKTLFITRKGNVDEVLEGIYDSVLRVLPDPSDPHFNESLTDRMAGMIEILAALDRLKAAFWQTDPGRVQRGVRRLVAQTAAPTGLVSPNKLAWDERKQKLAPRVNYIDLDAKTPVFHRENSHLFETLTSALIEKDADSDLASVAEAYHANVEKHASTQGHPEFARAQWLNSLLKQISVYAAKSPADLKERLQALAAVLAGAPDTNAFLKAMADFGKNGK